MTRFNMLKEMFKKERNEVTEQFRDEQGGQGISAMSMIHLLDKIESRSKVVEVPEKCIDCDFCHAMEYWDRTEGYCFYYKQGACSKKPDFCKLTKVLIIPVEE